MYNKERKGVYCERVCGWQPLGRRKGHTAGNTWSFSYASQDAEELTFSLTAENGKVYEGKKIYSHADCEEACEYFDFTFDGFKMEDLLFVSYDGTRFVFDNGGEEFVLTRIA